MHDYKNEMSTDMECGASLEPFKVLGHVSKDEYRAGKFLFTRICAIAFQAMT